MRILILMLLVLFRSMAGFAHDVTVCFHLYGPFPSVATPVVNTYTLSGVTYSDTVIFNPQSPSTPLCFPTFSVTPGANNQSIISCSISTTDCVGDVFYFSFSSDTIFYSDFYFCSSNCEAGINIGGALNNELTAFSMGVPPFQYNWNGGIDTTASIIGTFSGIQAVIVTDATGCTDTVQFSWFLPPWNDECWGAIQLYPEPQCTPVLATNFGATNSGISVSAPCGGDPDDDVWFSFIATSTIHLIQVIPSSNMDPVVELWSAGCSSGSVLTCENQANSAGQEILLASNLIPGQSYLIRVFGYNTGLDYVFGQGYFNICVQDLSPCAAFISGTGYFPDTLQAYSSGMAPFSYNWNDGSSDSVLAVNSPGDYCVTITDANGCSNATCFSVLPPNCYGTISAVYDSVGVLSLVAEPDSFSGPVSSYLWSDGSANQSIIPSDPGFYCVTITYVSGCFFSTCLYFDPSGGGSSCSVFAYAQPDSLNPVTYHFFAYPLGTPPFTFQWLFSDGATSFYENPVHTFSALSPGLWAMLTVTDFLGCTSHYSFIVNPLTTNAQCSNSFQSFANYQFGNIGEVFFFDSNSISGGLDQATYFWDFGDGTFSADTNPVHMYPISGVYLVSLTTIFNNGCSSVISIPLFIDFSWWNNNHPFQGNCTALFRDAPIPTEPSGMLSLINLSQGTNLLYEWTLSNGYGSNQAYPYLIFDTPGTYKLCMSILDTVLSCTDTFCDSILVDANGNISLRSFLGNVSIRLLMAPQPNSLLSVREQPESIEFSVFPNPGSDILSVSNVSDEQGLLVIKDVPGKTVKTLLLNPGQQDIDVQDLAPGLYFFSLSVKQQVRTQRQIIVR